MRWLRNLLNKFLPEDPDRGCGYFLLKLPLDHPFTRACDIHDWEFQEAHEGRGEKEISEVDWELFKRWFYITNAAESWEAKCALARDMCEFWPWANRVGWLLYDRQEQEKKLGGGEVKAQPDTGV